MRWPLNSYKINEGYDGHPPALDLAAPEGAEIYAPEDGVVLLVNNNPSAYFGGNYIRMRADSRIEYYMGHNSRNLVSPNQRVREGQVIGYVGHTGQATGPHIHFESVVNGKTVDFRTIIKEGDIPMFNAGDRINANVYFFKEDRGEFQGQVGKDYKTAWYEILESNPVKMEMYFNKGDAGNVNAYLYGEDQGKYRNAEGKTWKGAMYKIFESPEFRIDQLINEGDIGNINGIFGRDDTKKYIGKTWKLFFYEYVSKYAGKAEFEEVKDKLFKKKG